MKKFLSILLAVLLCMSGAALAEAAEVETAPAYDLTDLTVTLGTKSYTFPMSIEDCKAAGLNVPEFNPLPEDRYYAGLKVDNGRGSFKVRVELAGGEHWATGVTVEAKDVPAATVGGFGMGELTRGKLVELLGEPVSTSASYVRYTAFGEHLIWYFYFESEDAAATVNKIEARSTIPSKFGAEFADAREIAAEDLPDASGIAFTEFILDGVVYGKGSSVQTLIDNGWVLSKDAAEMKVDGNGGWLINGYKGYMYNGKGLIFIGAYNYTDKECDVADCTLTQLTVHSAYNTSLILADGITFGSELSAAEATLGAVVETEETDFGTAYSFKVLGDVEYDLTYSEDVLSVIAINGLN